MTITRTIIGAALAAIAIAWIPGSSSGQRSGRCEAYALGEERALAALTWHEEGVDGLEGAGALYDSIATLAAATGRTWLATVCAYSGRLFRGRTERAPWILELDDSGERPRHWPRGASWETDGPAYERLRIETRGIVAGEISSPCEIGPTDWGGLPEDGERIRRGERRGWWRRVDCGPHVRGVYLRRWYLDPDPD